MDDQFRPKATTTGSTANRMFSRGKSSILAIGSSTGGPQALLEVLKNLGSVNVPVVITQHMPPTFTKFLAKHLTSMTKFVCKEAEDGDILEDGKVYLGTWRLPYDGG